MWLIPVIEANTGDSLTDLIYLANHCNRHKNCSYVVIKLNNIKLFVKKSSKKKDIEKEYNNKLKKL